MVDTYLRGAANFTGRGQTPQTAPIPGREAEMHKNAAGGYSFNVETLQRVRRFLILGTEGATYYQTEQELSTENLKNLAAAVKNYGTEVVSIIDEISFAGRAPKNDPALFALAMCVALGDDATRTAAYKVLSRVARTGTHILHFVAYCKALGKGWGRGLRRAVGNWFTEKTAGDVAFQAAKYPSRDDWAMRDLLRSAHPLTKDPMMNHVLKWIVSGKFDYEIMFNTKENSPLAFLQAVDEAKSLNNDGAGTRRLVELIEDFNLPREVLPTEFLNNPTVWRALLQKMPAEAMIRNLGKMSSLNMLASLSNDTQLIVDRLGNREWLQKSRLHPIKVLSALKVYESGHGVKGNLTWTVNQSIVNALDSAFYGTFKNVRPTNKPMILGLDVSGSMNTGSISGIPGLTPKYAEVALALVLASVEPHYLALAFSAPNYPERGIAELNFGRGIRLDEAVRYVNKFPMGGTDGSLPMNFARENRINCELFVSFTDNENWAGYSHPSQALKAYRSASGHNAKGIWVGLTASRGTAADPNDLGMLDAVGFDSALPDLIYEFATGGF